MGTFSLESGRARDAKNVSVTEKVVGKAKDAYTGIVIAALTMVEQVASGRGTMVVKGEDGFTTVRRPSGEDSAD